MVGFILTGHGNFATGLMSSLNMILGKPEKIEAVDFDEGDGVDVLKSKLESAVRNVDADELIFFTDLLGGTPFKEAVRLANKLGRARVVSGTNLPMIVENIFIRQKNIDELVDLCLSSGRNSIIKYEERLKRDQSIHEGI